MSFRLPKMMSDERQWRSALSGFKESFGDNSVPMSKFNVRKNIKETLLMKTCMWSAKCAWNWTMQILKKSEEGRLWWRRKEIELALFNFIHFHSAPIRFFQLWHVFNKNWRFIWLFDYRKWSIPSWRRWRSTQAEWRQSKRRNGPNCSTRPMLTWRPGAGTENQSNQRIDLMRFGTIDFY